jgi:16S rRNA (guanine966-N2)-methyltransferase
VFSVFSVVKFFMRVTSGVFRGRLLRTPKGVRPTQDRVRKALFDVLGKDVPGSRVMDLFAGSGALGVEALSRGAASALFVEEEAGAVRTILANLEDLGFLEETGKRRRGDAETRGRGLPFSASGGREEEGVSPSGVGGGRADYRQAVRRVRLEGRTFNLILMDPPYRKGLLPEVLATLTGAEVVPPEGLVVAEAEARLPAPEADGLRLIDERVYGGTKLMFWVKREKP